MPHQAVRSRTSGSQRKPTGGSGPRPSQLPRHRNPGERPQNTDVLHSCRDDDKFVKETYPRVFLFAFCNVSTKLRAHCTITFTQNGQYFNKASQKRPPSVSSQPVSQAVIHLYLAIYQQWMSFPFYRLPSPCPEDTAACCTRPDPGQAREGPGCLPAHAEEVGSLFLESVQREGKNNFQNEGKHTCRTHPLFHSE